MITMQKHKTVTIYEVYKGTKFIAKGTVVELAERLGKNKTTIYRWSRQSKKPIADLVDHNVTFAIKSGKRIVKTLVYRRGRPGFRLKEVDF